jgi:fructose-bisphosphate aldolase class II
MVLILITGQVLAFDHLQAIADAVGADVPLVLHGGSGIPQEQVQKAISMGVSKVNVNTECPRSHLLQQPVNISKQAKILEGKGFDPRKLLAPGTKAVTELVEQRIEWFGSTNKA